MKRNALMKAVRQRLFSSLRMVFYFVDFEKRMAKGFAWLMNQYPTNV